MDTSGVSNAVRAREQLEVAYNQRDMDGILGLYDENPVFIDHALQQTLTSIEQIREYVEAQWAPAFSDEVVITDLIEAGDWTIARFVNKGVNDRSFGELPASGRPFEVDLCSLTRWQDGKIVEDHIYYDLYGALVQLGHAKPLATAAQAG